jgi:DNA modification methylase
VTPYYHDAQAGVTLYCADCRDLLPQFVDDEFGLVLTDPPYNVGQLYKEHDDLVERQEYLVWLCGILSQCQRVTRDSVCWFPGVANVWDVPDVLCSTGLRAARLLGWHKKEFAGDKWCGGPPLCWEPIVWATKAEKPHFNKCFGARGRDFLVVNATHGNPLSKHHPCPKPLKVMTWLVGLFAQEALPILDPFAGTGTTLVAAKHAGYPAVGIEVSEDYCRVAVERLAQGVLPFGTEDA